MESSKLESKFAQQERNIRKLEKALSAFKEEEVILKQKFNEEKSALIQRIDEQKEVEIKYSKLLKESERIQDENKTLKIQLETCLKEKGDEMKKFASDIQNISYEIGGSRFSENKTLRQYEKDLTIFKTLLGESEKHRKILQENNKNLESEVTALSIEVANLKKQNIITVAELNSKNISLEQSNSNLLSSNNAQEKEIFNLRVALNQINKDSQSSIIVDDLKSELNRLKRQNLEMTNEINVLKFEEISREKQFKQSQNEYKAALEELNLKIKATDSQNDSLINENHSLKQKFAIQKGLYSSISSLQYPSEFEARLEALSKENKVFSLEIEKLRKENETLTQKLQESDKENISLDMKGVKDYNQVISEIKDSISQINVAQVQIKSLSRERSDALSKEKEILNLKGELNDMYYKLNEDKSNISLLIGIIKKLDPKINLELRGYDFRSNDEHERNRLVHSLRDMNNCLAEDLNKFSELKSDINLKKDLEFLHKHVIDHSRSLDSLNKNLTLLKEFFQDFTLVEKVRKASMIIEEKKSQEQPSEESLSFLEKVRKEYEYKLRAYEGQYTEVMAESAKLTSELKRTDVLKKELEERLEISNSKIKEKDEVIQKKIERIISLSTELQAIQNRFKENTAKIASAEAKIRKLEGEIEIYETINKALDEKNREILASYEVDSSENFKKFNAEIDDIKSNHIIEVEKLKRELKELEYKSNNKSIQIDALNKRIDDLTVISNNEKETNQKFKAALQDKILNQEVIIRELNEKLEETFKKSQVQVDSDLQNFVNLNAALFKSKLSDEDHKTFEAIRDIQGQQKTYYEETIKALDANLEELTKAYFALELKHNEDLQNFQEFINKSKEENSQIIEQYEAKIKNLESQISETQGLAQAPQASHQEMNADKEKINQLKASIDYLKSHISELESIIKKEQQEKASIENLLSRVREESRKSDEINLDWAKIGAENRIKSESLAFNHSIIEMSWNTQLKLLNEQIECYKKKLEILEESRSNVVSTPSEPEIEALRFENLSLKRMIQDKEEELQEIKNSKEEKPKTAIIPETLPSGLRSATVELENKTLKQSVSNLTKENGDLKKQLEDLTLKIELLDKVPSSSVIEVEGEPFNISENLKGETLISVIEKAKNVILALNKK